MRSLLLICLLSLTGGAIAEEAVVDPPGRVARLSYTEGEVSLAPAGTEEWSEAVLNRPLTSGDRVWVDNGGRAELQIGSATIHLDANSGVSIIELDDDVLHLDLTEGSANLRVLRRRDNERIEVDTPNSTVSLLHPGEYRIEVNGAGDRTVVRTRNGGSEVTAGEKSWRVGASEEGVFDGTSELSARIEPLGPRTAFEDWANDRNRVSENPASSKYVSNEVVGYEDLQRHGSWVNEPSYGYVWQPTYVVSGWAPYRYGRWTWVSPWGWSWVDNAAWGFAPFHYGRWAYVRSRWCWVPGPRHVRPVYAPALVAWTGSPGVSVAVGFGSGVGWFPLGPREVYVPGHRYSRRYFNNVNVSNTVIVNNTYINNFYNGRPRNFDYRYGRDARAVTIVDRDRFVGGRPIDDQPNGQWTRGGQPDLRRWHHDSRPPAIAPNRDSVFAARTLGRIPGRTPDAARETRVQDQRSGFNRIPFDAERRAIEANGGRPIGRTQLMAAVQGTGDAFPNRLRVRDADATDRSTGRREQDRNASNNPDGNRDRAVEQRARALMDDARQDYSRQTQRTFSDRPSWAQQRQRDASTRAAPQVNSLQQQPRIDNRAGTSERTDRDRATGQWRDDSLRNPIESRTERRTRSQPDARDVFTNRNNAQRQEPAQRSWQPDSSQLRRVEQPRQVTQPRSEPPRHQQQPRYEQPQPSQPRQQQPRFDRGSAERAPQPQANRQSSQGIRQSESRRSGNDRPNFRPQ